MIRSNSWIRQISYSKWQPFGLTVIISIITDNHRKKGLIEQNAPYHTYFIRFEGVPFTPLIKDWKAVLSSILQISYVHIWGLPHSVVKFNLPLFLVLWASMGLWVFWEMMRLRSSLIAICLLDWVIDCTLKNGPSNGLTEESTWNMETKCWKGSFYNQFNK